MEIVREVFLWLMVLSILVAIILFYLLSFGGYKYKILKSEGSYEGWFIEKSKRPFDFPITIPSYRTHEEETKELDELRLRNNRLLKRFGIFILMSVVFGLIANY